MLGRAQNGERLTISKIVVGSGVAAVPDDLWPLVDPIAEQTPLVNISSKRDFGNGTLMVEGSFRSDQVGSAFYLREVGVYAHIASEADRLYSIANVFADPPDFIDPAAPTVQVFKIKLIIDRIPTDNLVVQIGPSEAVSGENVGADTVGPGVYKETLGNVLQFKRLVQGANMEIRDEPGGDAIYIGTSVLKNNIDLYVPLSYPGISDPNVLFPTIQAAHDYLLKFMIPTDKFATIHLDAGLFDGRVSLNHPNGQQISIVGRPRIDKAVTAINYVDATHKNVAANSSGLAVGYPVYLYGCDPEWAGGAYITAIAGNVLTLSTLKKDSRPNYTVTDSGAGGANRRLSFLPSIIYLANPNPGQPWPGTHVNVSAPNGMNFQNVCVVGGYHCLAIGGDHVNISNVFCIGGGTGLNVSCVCVLGWPNLDLVATDCGFGITGGGAGFIVGHNQNVRIVVNGCDAGIAVPGGYGAIPGVGATNLPVVYLSHNATGARTWGGTMSFGDVYFALNDIGFDAAYCGTIIFGVYTNFPRGNTTDLYAHGMGYINYKKGGGAEPVCNPAKGDPGGNQNSYIAVVP